MNEREIIFGRILNVALDGIQKDEQRRVDIFPEELLKLTARLSFKEIIESKIYLSILFNPMFLKWFFGTDKAIYEEDDKLEGKELVKIVISVDTFNVESSEMEAWQYHAINMMLSEDPIMYFQKFV